MMTVFYECLPVFCFKCGLVGHGEGSCPLGLGEPASGEAGEGAIVVDQFHGQQTRHLDIGEDASRASKMDSEPEAGNRYDPWLVVQHRRRGRGGGQVPEPGPGARYGGGLSMRDMWKEGKVRD